MQNIPRVTMVTDGSIYPNPGVGGWACIVRRDDNACITETILTGRDENMATNITMEMSAVIAGLNSLSEPSSVHLVTDLQMIANGITTWLPGWIARGWRNGQGDAVKNVGLWKQIHALLQVHDVTVEWTRGHVGHELNTRADQYAGKARLGELTNETRMIAK